MADDAVLVWPTGKGSLRASPLPTWGDLINVKQGIPGMNPYAVAVSFKIAGVILLKKADREKLHPLQPSEAAQHLYRALSEHPVVVGNRNPFRKDLFHTACKLAKAVPSKELELTRGGNFWNLLRNAFTDV